MSSLLRPEEAPAWLVPLVEGCARATEDDVPLRRRPSDRPAREAAVLLLFGETADAGPDVLLTERASELRAHAGQAAFPGGGMEPVDGEGLDARVRAALRETQEETGADPAGVVPLTTLPALTIPVTGFAVTPVVAHWDRPSPVHVVDPGETAAVERVPLAELTDPARRFTVTSPSGYLGPAFAVRGLLVWGFTALVLSWVLDLGGWTIPWDTADVRDLDEAWARRRDELTAHRADNEAARRREGDAIR
ncbi:CoA pyrophosphatase [Actinomycetospora sp. TBRC 11914]|uniref:NUDIX hydrolase n=1 Tax=Actinomycetospora sp. TBRC 11914 TaxID=2729387 RepID=UPI00145D67BB|nr:CoA pyrophosphatase [Actinomycetospora sp. TBRC 11914]NMO92194.1 CoA pyrophosphatase [Actinomycetospora sp. TBRC 11914]